MNWNDFYGAYVEYEHHGIYGYCEVIVNDWHRVMTELNSFVEKSTENFIGAFGDRINYEVDMVDYFEEFKYLNLNESMESSEAIKLIVKNEIKRNDYEVGTPYTSRRYWQLLEEAMECVWDEDKSYFKIHFEGPLPQFISKWHSYVMESCRVYPRILVDNSKSLFGPKVYPESYELLGKLSLFLDVDEKRFPEALRGFFSLVEDYNNSH